MRIPVVSKRLTPRRSWRPAGAAVISVVLLATSAPSAAGQVDIIDDTLKEGEFSGSVAISGGFFLDLGATDPRVMGGMLVSVEIAGPAQLVVKGDVLSGEWSASGSGGSQGVITSQGFDIELSTESTYEMEGTFGDTITNPRFRGTVSDVTTATVAFPTGTTSNTFSDSQPMDEPLTDILAGCNQIVARFDNRLNTTIEAELPAATAFFKGVLAVSTAGDAEVEAELEDLVQASAELQGGSDPFDDLFAAIVLLDRVQKFQAELAKNSDCPAEKEFFNVLTNVARSLMDTALDSLLELEQSDPALFPVIAAQTLWAIVDLGLGTGAFGAGAAGRGDALMERTRQITQTALDVASLDIESYEPALIELAALSKHMNWNLTVGEVSDGDVLCLFGAPQC